MLRPSRRSLCLAAAVAIATSTPAVSQTLRPAPSVTAVPPGEAATVRTAHLTVQAAASAAAVAPGDRLTLSIDVTPRSGMHVYAPGKHDYQVVRFSVDARPWLRAQPLRYPPSELYHFVPLDERVETYAKPFSLVQELNVLTSAAARRDLAGRQQVTIRGTLDYQACDDRICYAPTSVPLEFTLELASGGGR